MEKERTVDFKGNLMKNHTFNGKVSRFDAIKLTDEEEIPQDLNGKRAASIIFYKEGEKTHTSHNNKSKGKRPNVQVQNHMKTTEYLDPN